MESRKCDRCPADDSYENQSSLCAETQLAYNTVAWLCLECRHEWLGIVKRHPIAKRYSEAAFRLEYYKTKLGATGEGTLEDGLALWRELDDLETQLIAMAEKWLKQNATEEEDEDD